MRYSQKICATVSLVLTTFLSVSAVHLKNQAFWYVTVLLVEYLSKPDA